MNRYRLCMLALLLASVASRAAAQREPAEPAQATTRLEGRVLDAETDRLIPARVYIQAENGAWFFPKSISDKGSAVEYRKRRTEREYRLAAGIGGAPWRDEDVVSGVGLSHSLVNGHEELRLYACLGRHSG